MKPYLKRYEAFSEAIVSLIKPD